MNWEKKKLLIFKGKAATVRWVNLYYQKEKRNNGGYWVVISAYVFHMLIGSSWEQKWNKCMNFSRHALTEI